MPTAKLSFLERIDHFKKSLEVDTLNDHIITDVQHNSIARILRNGLAVVGFVALEDFIKKRTGEVLKEIGHSTVAFNDLPEKLKYSTTVEALPALSRIVKNEPTPNDEISLIQSQTTMISSTANTTYELTEFAFGYKNSNIDDKEIKRILTSFNISDGWGNMTNISGRIGLTSFPLENSFKNAASRRHRAAHTSSYNIPINDLKQFIREAIGLAIGFDCLLTKALHHINIHSVPYLVGGLSINSSVVKLSFVRKEKYVWKYKREGASRAVSVNSSKPILLSNAIRVAQSNNEVIVIFDEFNEVSDWYCF